MSIVLLHISVDFKQPNILERLENNEIWEAYTERPH
jgi:hypothetical protein